MIISSFSSSARSPPCGSHGCRLGATGTCRAPAGSAVGATSAERSQTGRASWQHFGALQHLEGAAPLSDGQGESGPVGVLAAGPESRRPARRAGAGTDATGSGKERRIQG